MKVLGRVNITTGGTPQPLVSVSTAAARYQRVRIQADPSNTSEVYVGSASMVTATGVGVAGVIGIPVVGPDGSVPVFDFGGFALPAGMDLSQIYIDGATNEGVYVCAI